MLKAVEYFAINGKTKITHIPSALPIKWQKPLQGWHKLNTDGSALGNPGQAGAGALIRNDKGEWVVGSARYLGHTSNHVVECWALKDGLTLAVQHGISKLEIELDSISAIAAFSSILNDNCIDIRLQPILNDCRSLFKEIQHKQLKHVFRETNLYADILAKHGSHFLCKNLDAVYKLFLEPPAFITNSLRFDEAGFIVFRTS